MTDSPIKMPETDFCVGFGVCGFIVRWGWVGVGSSRIFVGVRKVERETDVGKKGLFKKRTAMGLNLLKGRERKVKPETCFVRY